MILRSIAAASFLIAGTFASAGSAAADGARFDPRDERHRIAGTYADHRRHAADQRAWVWRARRARRDYDRYYDRSCLAVARRGAGRGRSIGIYAEGFGRRACRKAMRKCNRRLDIRQSYGRNPFAACVIAGRR